MCAHCATQGETKHPCRFVRAGEKCSKCKADKKICSFHPQVETLEGNERADKAHFRRDNTLAVLGEAAPVRKSLTPFYQLYSFANPPQVCTKCSSAWTLPILSTWLLPA